MRTKREQVDNKMIESCVVFEIRIEKEKVKRRAFVGSSLALQLLSLYSLSLPSNNS